MILGLVAALVGTFGYGVGTVLQAAGARRAQGLVVMRDPRYLAGLGCDAVAWAASLVALQRLPLFTVQALLAGSLCVTVLLARGFLGAALRVRDGVAIVFVTAALAVMAAASGVQATRPPGSWFVPTVVVSLAVVATLTAVLYRASRSVPMAVLAGVAFSGAALCGRAVQLPGAWYQVLIDPVVWCLVGFGVLGAVALSRSLEGGAVGLVAAVLWVIEVLLPGVVGVLGLGDVIRPGWLLSVGCAVVVALTGCVVLATSPAQPDR